MKKRKIAVVGAPVWLGQPHNGVQFGPEALRSAGLMKILRSVSSDAVDCANVGAGHTSAEPFAAAANMKHLSAVRASVQLLADKVSELVAGGRFPLILGGDHSIAIGSLAGIAKHYENLGIIWYDAHADINTPATSPTGNIHGMPLAASMGFGHPDLTGIGGYVEKVKPENVVMIGVRDIDPGEAELINKRKIKVFTAEDVARLGPEAIVQETMAYLAAKCDGIHLSFDLDALDPELACGVGTPAAEGIDVESTMEIIRLLYQCNRITSADIVEVNPLLDRHGQTVQIALAAVQTLFSGIVPGEMSRGVIKAG